MSTFEVHVIATVDEDSEQAAKALIVDLFESEFIDCEIKGVLEVDGE